jgi:hypothetical protein
MFRVLVRVRFHSFRLRLLSGSDESRIFRKFISDSQDYIPMDAGMPLTRHP